MISNYNVARVFKAVDCFENIRYLIRYLLVPNSLFILLNMMSSTSRGIFNLDYCLVGLIVPFTGRIVAALFYFLLFVIDLFYFFAPTYHFKPLLLMAKYKEIFTFQPFYLSLTGLAIVLMSVVPFVATKPVQEVRQNRHKFNGRLILVIAPFFLLTLDVLNGSNSLVRFRDNLIIKKNIIGTSLVQFVLDSKKALMNRDIKPSQINSANFASSPLWEPGFNNNIVLVIIESWGISADTELDKLITAPLSEKALSLRYQIREGKIPFKGATVSAELRELTGTVTNNPYHIGLKPLPTVLKNNGYDTFSIHAYLGGFFNRDDWYPHLGFSKSYFKDDLDKILPQKRACGTLLLGSCDDDIPALIRKLLIDPKNKKPKFIYWLTLNSHYPYGEPEGGVSLNCQAAPLSKQFEDVCNLSATIHKSINEIAKIAVDPALPSTRFILVGDHSPPFVMRSKQELYNKTHVPYIDLTPISEKE
jgi:hypothetical protein